MVSQTVGSSSARAKIWVGFLGRACQASAWVLGIVRIEHVVAMVVAVHTGMVMRPAKAFFIELALAL